jgi:hypothetical protein
MPGTSASTSSRRLESYKASVWSTSGNRMPSFLGRPATSSAAIRYGNYPTDFAPMSAEDLQLLTKRGEQRTHIIVDRYLPGLGD